MSLIQEFKYQVEALNGADFQVVSGRLTTLLDWMESQPQIKHVLDDLRATGEGKAIIAHAGWHKPPQAKTPKDIASVGLEFIEACRAHDLWQVAMNWGVQEYNAGNSIQPHSDKAVKSYIEPFLNYVLRHLPPEESDQAPQQSTSAIIPVAIQESLQGFKQDHPDVRKACFVMMRFGETDGDLSIEQTIKTVLAKYGLVGLLARDKEYHEDLYSNIQTYIHGCGFGIAVFERIESDEFNPNVSLEIGYLLGIRKPVLLLKDASLPVLQTDLMGKMYRSFDPMRSGQTIPRQVEGWLEDKGFI
jgi:hypothetical protein